MTEWGWEMTGEGRRGGRGACGFALGIPFPFFLSLARESRVESVGIAASRTFGTLGRFGCWLLASVSFFCLAGLVLALTVLVWLVLSD